MYIGRALRKIGFHTQGPSLDLWRQRLVGLLVIGFAVPVLAGFREDNIEFFRITHPPTTADHVLVAEFESAGELVVGWKCSHLDELAVTIVDATKSVVQIVVLADSAAEKTCMQNALASYGVDPTGIIWEIVGRETPWVGDYGPLAIRHSSSGRISFVDPRYFDMRPLDDKVPTELALSRGINVFRPSVLLPRSVVTDGQGTCFLSERDSLESLPDPDEAALIALMEDHLGCIEVVVLPPLVNAGTGNLSLAFTFLDSDTVLVGSQAAGIDCVNRDRLDAIAAVLQGLGYQVIRVPFPPDTDGYLRSYTDLVMVNGVVIVPEFPAFPSHNTQALAIMISQLPTWNIIPADASALETIDGGLGSMAVTLPVGDYSAQQAPPDPLCGDQASCQASGCGTVTFEGFCTNDTVVWCQDAQIHMYECSTPCFFVEPGFPCELTCGWAPEGYYDCLDDYVCFEPEIFADGFEDGSVSAWSNSRP